MKISEKRLRHIIKSIIKESTVERPSEIGPNVSVKEGDKVRVKQFPADSSSEHKYYGKVGEVVKVETSRFTGISYCDVKFDDGKRKNKIFCTTKHIEKVNKKEKKLSEQKLRKVIRQEIMNESVKDFFKGAIYSDYEIAIQNIVKSGNYTNSGDLYLVPASEVVNANVKIEEDELYSKENGETCVIILNEKTPLIGVSKITNYDFIKYKNRYREKLRAFVKENKLKPMEVKK